MGHLHETMTVFLLAWTPHVFLIVEGKKVGEGQGEWISGGSPRSSGGTQPSGGDAHCLLFLQPPGPPASEICARANLVGRNQNWWLLAQTFQLQGKRIVRYLTFRKTAGTSAISTDTFIKCHHFVSRQCSVLELF